MKGLVRRALLARPVNRAVRAALAPLPRRRVPRRLWLRLPAVGDFPVTLESGERFRYRSHGEYLGRVLYWRGPEAFEPGTARVVARLARSVTGFWDVGAYCGLYSLIATAVRPGLPVVAFEPLAENLGWLRENLALNGIDPAAAVGAAVSDRDAAGVDFWVPEDPWTSEAALSPSAAGDPGARQRRTVESVSIDGFRERRPGPPPGLIKIDAEGAEARILEGARRTLEECRPAVLCELLPEHAASAPGIERLLAALGYAWGPVTGAGVVRRPALAPSARHRNQLFWPAEGEAALARAELLA